MLFVCQGFSVPPRRTCQLRRYRSDPQTLAAIKQGLHRAIPRVMAAGSNKVTGQNPEFNTPPQLRLSAEALKSGMARIIKNYSVKVLFKNVN